MASTGKPLDAKEATLWLFQVMNPEAVVHVPMAFRTTGRTLRWWPMKVAVDTLVQTHPALRTVFADVDGSPVRTVLDPAETDIEVETFATDAGTLTADLHAFASRPFRVTEEPLIRVGHFTGDPAGDVVCFTSHHLISDAQSNAVLLRTFMEVYEAAAAEGPLPERFTVPVEPFTEPAAAEADLRFWREHLAGAEKTARALSLAEPDDGEDYRGWQIVRPVPAATAGRVAAAAKELNSSPHMLLLAVFYLLLADHGAGEDIVVGMPLDARTPVARETVGYHVNIVGLRGTLDFSATFREWAQQVRERFLTGLRHVRASIDEALPGSYDTASDWREPLFRYMFNYSPFSADWATRYAIEVVPVQMGYSRLDLTLNVIPRGEELLVQVIYRQRLYPEVAVDRLIDRFSTLLAACVADPDLPLRDYPFAGAADLAVRAETAEVSVRDTYGRELPPGVWGEVHRSGTPTGRRGRWGWTGELEQAAAPAERSTQDGAAPADGAADPEVVAMLVELWRELLALDDVDEHSHFFRSGGTSIKAGRAVAMIKKDLGVKVKLRQVFATPTPAGLAAAIAAAKA